MSPAKITFVIVNLTIIKDLLIINTIAEDLTLGYLFKSCSEIIFLRPAHFCRAQVIVLVLVSPSLDQPGHILQLVGH